MVILFSLLLSRENILSASDLFHSIFFISLWCVKSEFQFFFHLLYLCLSYLLNVVIYLDDSVCILLCMFNSTGNTPFILKILWPMGNKISRHRIRFFFFISFVFSLCQNILRESTNSNFKHLFENIIFSLLFFLNNFRRNSVSLIFQITLNMNCVWNCSVVEYMKII